MPALKIHFYILEFKTLETAHTYNAVQPPLLIRRFSRLILQTYHLKCNFLNVPYFFIFGGNSGVDLSAPLALDLSDGPASHPSHQPHLCSLCCCHPSIFPPSFRPVNMSPLLSVFPPYLIHFHAFQCR